MCAAPPLYRHVRVSVTLFDGDEDPYSASEVARSGKERPSCSKSEKRDGMGKKRDEISRELQYRVEIAKIGARAAKEIAVAAAPALGNPALAPVVMSPKVGEATEKAVMWVAGFGYSGTGKWIRGLHGVARTDSTLARLGLGTLVNGGWGRAGGARVVAVAGTAVSTAVFAGWLANGLVATHSKLKTEAEQSHANVVLCPNCQEVLPMAATDGEIPACPHCEAAEKPELD
ncbi:hypothetical protein ACX80N_12480 [Arthrobacter sp. MDT2-16]